MKILITGGAGFIGSNFINYMLKKYSKYEIINLDLLTYASNLENLKNIQANKNYKFIKGNICHRGLVQSIIERGVNCVINFAAETHVDRSIESPQVFIETNVLGTGTLLDAAKMANIQKFIQISTDEVYGSLGAVGLFTEETPLSPNSPYSASKAGADVLVHSYYKTFGLPVNITRCSNNYGPYQFPEKLIPLIIIKALKDEHIPVYGDGLNVRDWLYVEDHCRAIDLVLHKGESGEIYNIGGNNEKTNLEIVKLILYKLGKSEELIEHVTDRLGHDRRYAIDPSKIRGKLGFEPAFEFEEGINKTITWYVSNKGANTYD